MEPVSTRKLFGARLSATGPEFNRRLDMSQPDRSYQPGRWWPPALPGLLHVDGRPA